jgi:hypothetical protein
LIFHVFLPFAKLPRVPGRLAHVQRLGETPSPPFSYEWRQICVGQIVPEECCYPQVLLRSAERVRESVQHHDCQLCQLHYTTLYPKSVATHRCCYVQLNELRESVQHRDCQLCQLHYTPLCPTVAP